jgi:hypothetical protein
VVRVTAEEHRGAAIEIIRMIPHMVYMDREQAAELTEHLIQAAVQTVLDYLEAKKELTKYNESP